LILADNGGNGYAIVAADARWDQTDLACISSYLSLGNLEPVNVSSIIKQLNGSNLPTVSYKTNSSIPTVAAAPSFTPASGTYTTTQTVIIGTATPSATIYYTTNGSTPTTSSPVYAGPITVSATETLRAIAVATGDSASSVSSAAYIITPPAGAPAFSPGAGTYTSAQTVAISTSTPAATIYYTTNGTTPTSSSAVYAGPITVGATETLAAIALATGDSASSVSSAAYIITPPATPPAFSPAAGTYSSAQTVTMSTTTPSTMIYYTTDGSTPTTSSPTYTGPITISTTETLKAIAVSATRTIMAVVATIGSSASPVSSAVYTITPPTAVPAFSPAGGTYSSPQTVTISTATPSATIYYTADGSTPTTSSPVYTGPITISTTVALKAVAVATGSSASLVNIAAYTITPPAALPTFSPAGGTYSSAQTITINTTTPSATIHYTTNGSTPTTSSPVYAGPITASATETISAIAVIAGNSTSSVNSATYTIVPPPAAPSFSPAGGTYSSAQVVTISSTTPSATIYYTTNGSTPTTSSLVYTGPITVSATEILEAIALVSGNSASQVSRGISMVATSSASPVSSAAYTIAPSTGVPTFSPAAGTYSSAQAVTISSATPSATIFYTTNGTTPTTSSPIYAGPITVGGTETLAAVAMAASSSASQVNSAAYTITPAPVRPNVPPTAPPTFSPASGTYSSAQIVTISSTTPSATIYYTTDGRTPTTNSPVYAGPITVGANETLKAFAVVADSANDMLKDRKTTRDAASETSSAAYIITPSTAVATSKPANGNTSLAKR